MAKIYLPVQATEDMTSEERAIAINTEVYSLRRPDSMKNPDDVTLMYYGTITHPVTNQVALITDSADMIRIHPEVDLTVMLSLMPEIPQNEKDQLSAYINANRGGSVPFGTFIPTTSVQLTEEEADAAGWIPSPDMLNPENF